MQLLTKKPSELRTLSLTNTDHEIVESAIDGPISSFVNRVVPANHYGGLKERYIQQCICDSEANAIQVAATGD